MNLLPSTNYSKKDFETVSVLGQGGYGKVYLVKKKHGADQGQVYAMKAFKKCDLVRLEQVDNTLTEGRILRQVDHPFVVKLLCTFETKDKLFYILEYCPGGELFFYLQNIGRFKESVAKFYAANILLAFRYIHAKNILYRDLKPENVLLDSDGYLKLTDFGLSKENISRPYGYFEFVKDDQNSPDEFTRAVICGTAEYLAPELLKGNGFGRSTDFWSFGCLLYEMLVGLPPFHCSSRALLYQGIMSCHPNLDHRFLSPEAKDLCLKLLMKDPVERLGSSSQGIKEIMGHEWFAGIDWEGLEARKVPAPYKPVLEGPSDVKYFDKHFTQMKMSPDHDSVVMLCDKPMPCVRYSIDDPKTVRGASSHT